MPLRRRLNANRLIPDVCAAAVLSVPRGWHVPGRRPFGFRAWRSWRTDERQPNSTTVGRLLSRSVARVRDFDPSGRVHPLRPRECTLVPSGVVCMKRCSRCEREIPDSACNLWSMRRPERGPRSLHAEHGDSAELPLRPATSSRVPASLRCPPVAPGSGARARNEPAHARGCSSDCRRWHPRIRDAEDLGGAGGSRGRASRHAQTRSAHDLQSSRRTATSATGCCAHRHDDMERGQPRVAVERAQGRRVRAAVAREGRGLAGHLAADARRPLRCGSHADVRLYVVRDSRWRPRTRITACASVLTMSLR